MQNNLHYHKIKAHMVWVARAELPLVKGIVHPNMKITHPHVIPNLYDLHWSSEHKLRYFWWNPRAFWPSIDSKGITAVQRCKLLK